MSRASRKKIAFFFGFVFVPAVFVIFSNACIILATMHRVLPVESAKVMGLPVIVLGTDDPAAVARRCNAAYTTISAAGGAQLLVSGHPDNHGVKEAPLMADALEKLGVSPTALILDDGGSSTLATMRNAQKRYGIKRAIVVTDSYHIHRSLFLAEHFSIEAFGVAAKPSRLTALYVWCCLRECLSRPKALVQSWL